MKRDNSTLKTYFETGDYPTESQFADLIDSFLNIDENDAVTGITDNGDDTYTFQLLSGGSVTLNSAGIPDNIPIANIIGLQAALNTYVDLSTNQTVGGEKIWSASHQFNGRIGIGNFPFGPNRLGDSVFQAPNIDTQALNWKNDAQQTLAAIFMNPSGTVMTIKGFDDSVMVTDFTSIPGVEGVDPHESTIANTIEHTNGAIFINDQGVQSYPGATTPVANAFFQVLQNRNGGARKPYWFGYYDGTTYETIWEVAVNGVVTFNQVTKGKNGVAPEDFVTKAQLDAINGSGNFLAKDQDETTSGSLVISMGSFADDKSFSIGAPGSSGYFKLNNSGWTVLGNVSSNDGQNSFLILKRNGDFEISDNGTIHTIWHSGNDGSRSGLDADTLDGIQAGSFVRDTLGVSTAETNRNVKDTGIYTYNANANSLGGSTPNSYWSVMTWGRGTSGSAQLAANWVSGGNELWFRSLRDTTDNWWSWKKIWHSGNDGSGSGLDADTLDGIQANAFLRSDTNDTLNGILTVTNRLNINRIDTNSAQQIVLNAGESSSFASGQTNEYVYINAELGLEINTSPDNWNSGWAGRNITRITGTNFIGNNKDLIRYSDNWLRINPDNDFTSGIYCGTRVLRTDGQFECGPNGVDFKVTTSGAVTAAGTMTASNFILSSDKRFKNNIKILNAKPIKANWASFEMKGETRFGVIAQELEEEHPEFVRTDEEGYKSVAYIDLLVAKNAELEARIEKLEALITKLL
jgi:hypothetical protein